MITGGVSGRRVLVSLPIRIAGQPDIAIEFVLDTGFAGFLTLPAAAIATLGLPFSHSINANLADGSRIRVDVHLADILWNGEERHIEILATGLRPLLGTLLLDGSDVSIQFTEGGLVAITPL